MIKRIWNEFSFHTVFMKLVVCFISPRQRLGDIEHTPRFINTLWNENSFQKLVVCFISPRQRLGDIKHTTRFINTLWNENSFQILYTMYIALRFSCINLFKWMTRSMNQNSSYFHPPSVYAKHTQSCTQ